MKLLDILLEVLRESKPITLDKSVVPQMEKIYDKFKKLENDEHTKKYFESGGLGIPLGRITFNNPYDPSFKGVDVDLGFNNEEIKGEYNSSTSTIYINLNSPVGTTKSRFLKTLYHELVHAIDPKVNDYKVSTSLNKNLDKKKDKDKSSSSRTKYLKDPAEFDAWSSTFVNQIKDALEVLPDADKQKTKAALKVLINDLLGLLKKYPNSGLKDSKLFRVFDAFIDDADRITQLDVIKELIPDDPYGLEDELLLNIIFYLNKPSQFKKYIQRLSTLL